MTRSLVVGAGSIGQRHAVVLADLGHDVAIVSARTDVGAFASIPDAVAEFVPEYVIVATPTARHADSVASLSSAGYAGLLLVEKPVAVDGAALAAFERVGVGFNLRFHPVIARMRELLSATTVHTVEAYVGQHLSTWRPDRPAAEQYSASRAAGGGALRDLSHEFDYLGWLLGGIRGVFALGGRLTDLTVDSDDAWAIVAEYAAAPVVSLQLNYLDRPGRRRITANTAAGTYVADVVAGTVETPGGIERFDVERNTSYRALHVAMLEGSDAVCTAAEAVETDRVIAMVERSATAREWVRA